MKTVSESLDGFTLWAIVREAADECRDYHTSAFTPCWVHLTEQLRKYRPEDGLKEGVVR